MHSVECWGLTLRGQIDYCICGYGPSRAEDERVQELESQLKTLQEKLERAKEALRFYADPQSYLFCQNQFLEFNDAASTKEITQTSIVGAMARACLAELEAKP